MKTLHLLGLAAVAATLSAAAPPRIDPRIMPGDSHDLVLLHPSRPYRVRLHVQPDGRSFVSRWRDRVAILFAHLDTDRDGKLSRAETRAAPSRVQWAQVLHGEPFIEPDAAPDFADLAGGSKEVKLDQLAAYYAESVAGPLRVRWAWRRTDPLSAVLWKHLDTDRDNRLSKAELRAASRVLAALDRDDDELLTAAELLGVRGIEMTPAAHAGLSHGPALGGLPLLSLRPGGLAGPLVEGLLAAYDRDKDGKLSAREIGLDGAPFRRLDRDGDGKLDARELAAWRDFPPDVSVIVPLGENARGQIETLPGTTPAVTVRTQRDSTWLLFGDHTVEVRRAVGGLPARVPAIATADLFSSLDQNSDGVLDSREVQRPPFRHVSWLRLADRDGDGRISRKEFDAFVALQQRLRGTMTSLRVDSEDRSLFHLLDADGDGRLGPREVRNAVARLSPWLDEKETVSREKLPRQFRVTLAHGVGQEVRPGRPAVRGPVWFRKMDRNRDGDVSRKEWLGTEAQFREIDADGDGLIDPEEAGRADRLMRTPR